jgi:heme oxygenase
MHAFARGLDAALRDARLSQRWVAWRLPERADWLAEDLRAIGCAPLPVASMPALRGDAQGAAALYVVEGAALGARVLLADARRLGHGRNAGACFLHRHAEGEHGQRWPRFVRALDADFSGSDPAALCAAANAAFAFADRCFSTAAATTTATA